MGLLFTLCHRQTAARLSPPSEIRPQSYHIEDLFCLLWELILAVLFHLQKTFCVSFFSDSVCVIMADYSPREIMHMVKVLGEARGNYSEAERLYPLRYPDDRPPCRRTIRELVGRAEHGDLRRNRRKTGPREVHSVTTIGAVIQNPHISTRDVQRIHGISKSTVNRILRHYNFHPYHVHLTQALRPEDPARRLQFCNWSHNQLARDPFFFDRVLFSDEAKFDNCGGVNTHNAHYYAEEQPSWRRNRTIQTRWTVNVWGGVLGEKIIGPFFYQGMMNQHIYLNLMQNELPVLLEEVPLDIRRRMWFQQDGAGAHRTIMIRNFLNRQFPRSWIGLNSPVQEWPPSLRI